jgi:amidase
MTVEYMSAVGQAALIRKGEISSRELLDVHLARVERWNPRVNAIVTLVPDLAYATADRLDEQAARGEFHGPLHGLPIAHKDLHATKGIRTTWGSPIYSDHVPAANALVIDRLQAAGAVTFGKTNTPEFGAGSQTFNTVFGATANPYDLSRTSGGSSGGSAVALATGMMPIADGSDMGGSLRNPASFCNVVGLRPSPGRVPSWPTETPWSPLGVAGPMARTVADLALILSAVAGPDDRAPLSINEPPDIFGGSLGTDLRGVRVAWAEDLDWPVDTQVRAALAPARQVFEDLGCTVVDAKPELTGVRDAFQALRALEYEIALGATYNQHSSHMKGTVRWNIEEARRRNVSEIAAAHRAHVRIVEQMRAFMIDFEALILPVSQVPPFDIDVEWVPEIEGNEMETYIDWMRSCSDITMTGMPALSVPAGFTPEGLPVGIQIVGRPQQDFRLLQIGRAFEQATLVGNRRPQP